MFGTVEPPRRHMAPTRTVAPRRAERPSHPTCLDRGDAMRTDRR